MRTLLVPIWLVAVSLSTGCSPAYWNGVAAGMAGTAPPAAPAEKLMLFGGPGHRTYLGCVTCAQCASDPVFNAYFPLRSSYAADSIVNLYSQFGSAYSNFAACNPY